MQAIKDFRPYQGDDVNPRYTQVEINGLGKVWACFSRATEDEVNPLIHISGWGNQPTIRLRSLPLSTQQILIDHHKSLLVE